MTKTGSEAGPTPGPWRFERIVMSKYGVDAYFEVKGGPTEDESVGVFARDVCQTIMREIGSEDSLLAEDEANVRLIAAAPEMLQALEAVYKSYSSPDHMCMECGEEAGTSAACESCQVDKMVVAALAKAKGPVHE